MAHVSRNIKNRNTNKYVSLSDIVKRNISLTSKQLNRVRKLHEDQLLRLLRIECYVESELKEMEIRLPPYSSHRYPERDKLQKRLWEIEKERQKLKLRLEEKVRGLEDNLHSLMNKWKVVGRGMVSL